MIDISYPFKNWLTKLNINKYIFINISNFTPKGFESVTKLEVITFENLVIEILILDL